MKSVLDCDKIQTRKTSVGRLESNAQKHIAVKFTSRCGFWHVPTEYETQINGQQHRRSWSTEAERTDATRREKRDWLLSVRDTRPTGLQPPNVASVLRILTISANKGPYTYYVTQIYNI